MTPDPITAAKFFSGVFNPKTHLKTFSFLIIIAFWALIGWSVYTGLIKPHTKYRLPTTTQKAEKIENVTNNYPEKKSFIDWKLWIFRVTIF